MTRSETHYFWFSGRVSLCFSFENEFKFQIVLYHSHEKELAISAFPILTLIELRLNFQFHI